MNWWQTLLGWGGNAVGFLGGIKIWLIAGGIVVLVVGFLWIENQRLAAERDLAQQQANDAIAVIESIQADNALARKLVAARDAKIAEQEKATRALIENLRRQPITRGCSSSPAIRALLDSYGLRNEGAGQTR